LDCLLDIPELVLSFVAGFNLMFLENIHQVYTLLKLKCHLEVGKLGHARTGSVLEKLMVPQSLRFRVKWVGNEEF
jgi:hypothetical protein